MSIASARPLKPAATAARTVAGSANPFLGLLEGILVEGPIDFEFDGAIARSDAAAAWTWMLRDLAEGRIDPEAPADDAVAREALDALLPELLERAQAAVAGAATSHEAERRLKGQLGGEGPWKRLPLLLNALRCRKLLTKAVGFGRAANGLSDEAALAHALQSMPLQDQAIAALLMQATVGQVTNPGRLITASIRIAGAASEAAIRRAGLAPLIDAILAHSQDQLPKLQIAGPFADIDLACRALHRFHRLIRSVHNYVELERNGRWAMIVAALTKQVSQRVEPRLRDVTLELNQALRRQREGADRLDSDQLLVALNGVYVLVTVRDCRESLALNALFDKAWTEVGEALEPHIQRNLEMLRQNPADANISARLDTAIKMAELRFNAEYADVLRRAKDAAEKR
jgi:hypothetical protein